MSNIKLLSVLLGLTVSVSPAFAFGNNIGGTPATAASISSPNDTAPLISMGKVINAHTVTAVAAKGDNIFAATDDGTVYKYTGNNTWSQFGGKFAQSVTNLVANSTALYASSGTEVYKSSFAANNGTGVWTKFGGSFWLLVTNLAVNDSSVFTSAGREVYKSATSANSGQGAWAKFGGTFYSPVTNLAVNDSNVFTSAAREVYKSATDANAGHGTWAKFGGTFYNPVTALAVNDGSVFASNGTSVYKSAIDANSGQGAWSQFGGTLDSVTALSASNTQVVTILKNTAYQSTTTQDSRGVWYKLGQTTISPITTAVADGNEVFVGSKTGDMYISVTKK